MSKLILLLLLIGGLSPQEEKSIIRDNVYIKVYPYEYKGKMIATAMPELKAGSKLIPFKRRFDYLLMNCSEIHSPEHSDRRNAIFDLFPDTTEMKRLYLNTYVEDKKLVSYFEETLEAIENPSFKRTQTFTVDELMEVSSKFFYCDKVKEDTSVQAHVCIGLNGVSEANWDIDYTYLEAFCYEGIFNAFDAEKSKIWDAFIAQKKKASKKHRKDITSLDQYLEKVKLDLFERMENNKYLKKELMRYYKANESNLAFRIKNKFDTATRKH